MLTTADHARLVDILLEGNIDYKAIVTLLIKDNPHKFMALHDKTQQNTVVVSPGLAAIAVHLVQGAKVSAIKALRELTGASLRDAKVVIDHADAKFHLIQEKPVDPNLYSYPIPAVQWGDLTAQQYYEQLVNAISRLLMP